MTRLTVFFLALLLASPAVAQNTPRLTIYRPAHYQVVQRIGGAGAVHISGLIEPNGLYTVEVDWGAGWQSIVTDVISTFDAYVTLPQGQYTLTVRAGGLEAIVNYVGVGDVFIIAGQSNAMGMGTVNQVYSHPTLRASMYANSYQWTELRDPTDSNAGGRERDGVNADALAAGSVWPLLATYIMADQNVPVAFIPTANASTAIRSWLPWPDIFDRRGLFGAMLTRAGQAGDVLAILWWQGETDAVNRVTSGQYAYYLNRIANTAHEYTGAILMPALLQHIRLDYRYTWQINEGIRQAAVDNPYIELGADLSDLYTDDAYHLRSNAKLATAAERWWAALDAALMS